MLNALIVDDEPRARQELRRALESTDDIRIIGECGNALDALRCIHSSAPDVVFLDIQMPQVTGLEMLGMLDPASMPEIVFLTAYDEYAVEAFEKNAFDYLLKPVAAERLHLTLTRLRAGLVPRDFAALPEANCLKQIPCFSQQAVHFLRLDEVESVESRASGVYVTDLAGRERPTDLRLNVLEQRTPLLRCHRQYLINMDQVDRLCYLDDGLAQFVTRSGRNVPVSRRLLPSIKQQLGIS